MFKLLKNLKKTWVSVIIIIILLGVQATSDLALPEYTSKIINIGIQQSGIENSVPEVMSKSSMEKLLMFAENKEDILNNYKLISKEKLNKEEYDKYLKEYPLLEKEELYICNELEKDELNKLSLIMSKPLMTLKGLETEKVSDELKTLLLEKLPKEMQEKYAKLTTVELLKICMNNETNKTEISQIIEKSNEQINKMPESIVGQAAIQEIKEEYQKVGIDMEKYQNRYILTTGLKMLGIAFVIMMSAISIMFLSSRVAAKLGETLREKVFKKVLKFSTTEFKEFSTASLITRSTNDIQQIQNLIALLFRVIVYAPIIGIGGFFKVLATSNNSMAWIIGLAIGLIILVVSILFAIAMPRFKKLQELIDKLNSVSREILNGLPVIRAFNTEKREEERFDEANKNLTKTYKFVNNAMNLMMPILMLIMNSISLLIIWIGGHKVDSGIMQVGDIMAFLQYSMQIVMAFLMISMTSIMLPRASVSAKRINEILDKDESIKDPKDVKEFDDNKKGVVEFKNVSFQYPDADEPILKDITFTANPGETTAIIGSTGSGKSTVVNLIPRFYDITSGELLIDGVNVKDVTQKSLREKIGFVPQKGVLFSGTIESNIKYSNQEMSDEQMKLAAEISQSKEFIEEKENKYKTEIAQGGNNVSGGQRQRLSIARAIAKDPEILVFDDSFSALDYKTDANLRKALSEKTQNKTVIIVAQRINTILNAEQIIVLDEGKIVGKGTHKELMKNNEVYKQIALSQLSKEELE